MTMSSVAEVRALDALADPMRRRLVMDLAERSPRTATELAGSYPITRQGIIKHLHILRDAGLVERRRDGREALYGLVPDPLQDAVRWIRDVTTTWDARLQRLKTFVETEPADRETLSGA
jgi:DNA-binding transcriptional ArsR family regulator